ncbi:hypothetical protein AK812_SmicGene24795 [Symbiodinium microadriaticum]|uniref:Uncharacterized protein n=1 Tax=Symbiodinium microadriaticum TaxID=2951 RepID=A0A1Q9DDW5_SYMMI|nr:hypothetical protein AK812_SmicGene24795 [Symbiodinium microadriaticum]
MALRNDLRILIKGSTFVDCALRSHLRRSPHEQSFFSVELQPGPMQTAFAWRPDNPALGKQLAAANEPPSLAQFFPIMSPIMTANQEELVSAMACNALRSDAAALSGALLRLPLLLPLLGLRC